MFGYEHGNKIEADFMFFFFFLTILFWVSTVFYIDARWLANLSRWKLLRAGEGLFLQPSVSFLRVFINTSFMESVRCKGFIDLLDQIGSNISRLQSVCINIRKEILIAHLN